MKISNKLRYAALFVILAATSASVSASPITWDFTSRDLFMSPGTVSITGTVVFEDTNSNYVPGGTATVANGAISGFNLQSPSGSIVWDIDNTISVFEIMFGSSTLPSEIAAVNIDVIDDVLPAATGQHIEITGSGASNIATHIGDYNGDGTFTLAGANAAVPEPASIALWLLLGTALIGYRWMRRLTRQAKA